MSVVGVVADVRRGELKGSPRPEFYIPHARNPVLATYLVARTGGDPTAFIPAVRAAIWEVDPDQPVFEERAMGAVLDVQLAPWRPAAQVMSVLSVIALLLAAVGIYGVMTYGVSQRTREIGVRMALGAEAGDILKLVARNGLFLTAAGIAIGLAGATALTRFMSSILYEVSVTDPTTFGSTALLLAAVALVACFIPARRATRVNSVVALRQHS